VRPANRSIVLFAAARRSVSRSAGETCRRVPRRRRFPGSLAAAYRGLRAGTPASACFPARSFIPRRSLTHRSPLCSRPFAAALLRLYRFGPRSLKRKAGHLQNCCRPWPASSKDDPARLLADPAFLLLLPGSPTRHVSAPRCAPPRTGGRLRPPRPAPHTGGSPRQLVTASRRHTGRVVSGPPTPLRSVAPVTISRPVHRAFDVQGGRVAAAADPAGGLPPRARRATAYRRPRASPAAGKAPGDGPIVAAGHVGCRAYPASPVLGSPVLPVATVPPRRGPAGTPPGGGLAARPRCRRPVRALSSPGPRPEAPRHLVRPSGRGPRLPALDFRHPARLSSLWELV